MQTGRFDGLIPGDSARAAIKLLADTVQREALVLSYNDLLLLLGAAFAASLVLLPFVKNPRSALTADRH
jgi:DHA2 family multidrug resistance protein